MNFGSLPLDHTSRRDATICGSINGNPNTRMPRIKYDWKAQPRRPIRNKYGQPVGEDGVPRRLYSGKRTSRVSKLAVSPYPRERVADRLAKASQRTQFRKNVERLVFDTKRQRQVRYSKMLHKKHFEQPEVNIGKFEPEDDIALKLGIETQLKPSDPLIEAALYVYSTSGIEEFYGDLKGANARPTFSQCTQVLSLFLHGVGPDHTGLGYYRSQITIKLCADLTAILAEDGISGSETALLVGLYAQLELDEPELLTALLGSVSKHTGSDFTPSNVVSVVYNLALIAEPPTDTIAALVSSFSGLVPDAQAPELADFLLACKAAQASVSSELANAIVDAYGSAKNVTELSTGVVLMGCAAVEGVDTSKLPALISDCAKLAPSAGPFACSYALQGLLFAKSMGVDVNIEEGTTIWRRLLAVASGASPLGLALGLAAAADVGIPCAEEDQNDFHAALLAVEFGQLDIVQNKGHIAALALRAVGVQDVWQHVGELEGYRMDSDEEYSLHRSRVDAILRLASMVSEDKNAVAGDIAQACATLAGMTEWAGALPSVEFVMKRFVGAYQGKPKEERGSVADDAAMLRACSVLRYNDPVFFNALFERMGVQDMSVDDDAAAVVDVLEFGATFGQEFPHLPALFKAVADKASSLTDTQLVRAIWAASNFGLGVWDRDTWGTIAAALPEAATLTPVSLEPLRQAHLVLKHCHNVTLLSSGHTDAIIEKVNTSESPAYEKWMQGNLFLAMDAIVLAPCVQNLPLADNLLATDIAVDLGDAAKCAVELQGPMDYCVNRPYKKMQVPCTEWKTKVLEALGFQVYKCHFDEWHLKKTSAMAASYIKNVLPEGTPYTVSHHYMPRKQFVPHLDLGSHSYRARKYKV